MFYDQRCIISCVSLKSGRDASYRGVKIIRLHQAHTLAPHTGASIQDWLCRCCLQHTPQTSHTCWMWCMGLVHCIQPAGLVQGVLCTWCMGLGDTCCMWCLYQTGLHTGSTTKDWSLGLIWTNPRSSMQGQFSVDVAYSTHPRPAPCSVCNTCTGLVLCMDMIRDLQAVPWPK